MEGVNTRQQIFRLILNLNGVLKLFLSQGKFSWGFYISQIERGWIDAVKFERTKIHFSDVFTAVIVAVASYKLLKGVLGHYRRFNWREILRTVISYWSSVCCEDSRKKISWVPARKENYHRGTAVQAIGMKQGKEKGFPSQRKQLKTGRDCCLNVSVYAFKNPEISVN